MRQLVIFAAYIQVGTQSEVKVRERLAQLNAMYKDIIPKEEQDECNVLIKWIVVPVKEPQETKIECIYPVPGMNEDILNKLGLLEEKTKRIKI